MKKTLPGVLTILLVASLAHADLDFPRQSAHDVIVPHGTGGATGFCSIIYYNTCSNWFWLWGGWGVRHEVGVVFDLPSDCGQQPGEECVNTHFWWYWRYTHPGHGFTVTYRLYEVDASN